MASGARCRPEGTSVEAAREALAAVSVDEAVLRAR